MAPPTSAPSGSSQARSPNPPPGGSASTSVPELRDERVLDLLLRVAGGDADADERLHALGHGGVRLVERRLADGAHELGLEIGRVRGRGGRGADGDAPSTAASASARLTSRAPGRSPRAASGGRPRRRPRRRTSRRRALAVEDERLGKAGHAIAVERVARPVVHERECQLEADPRTSARPRGSPSHRGRRPRGRGRDCPATPARGTAPPPCTGCTTTPRRSARRPCRAATTAGGRRPRRGARA